MAFNICDDYPEDLHAEANPREPRNSVDITVTECPSFEELDLCCMSKGIQTSHQSHPEGICLEGEEEAEYPDRISPLGFMTSWRDTARSNSLPDAGVRDGLLGEWLQNKCNKHRNNNISTVSLTEEMSSHTNIHHQSPMKRPIALSLDTFDSYDHGTAEEQGCVHQLLSHPTILYTNAPSIETTELREEISRFTMFRPISSPMRRDSISPCRSPVRSPMSSRSLSLALSNRSLSPVLPRMVRSHSICGGPVHLSPQDATHMPRDPCQPSRGSISDLSSGAEGRVEEEDIYDLLTLQRPRSRTCPENRAWKRRARLKAQHRPSTPPPVCSPSFIGNHDFAGRNRAKSAEKLFAQLSVEKNA